jgi:triosephosphate isomerase
MATLERRPLVAANWKMQLTRAEAATYCRALLAGGTASAVEILLLPSYPLLGTVTEALAGSAIALGAQDLSPEPGGAFTGDVSAAQLVDAGCRYVICGHSERRRLHGEDDALVAAKARAALASGLAPIVCVGESREERHGGRTFDVLARQLEPLPVDPRLVLAYEPLWAIGTGETATPDTAADAHSYLRSRLERRAGAEQAARQRILYGGSVTPENAPALAGEHDIDGFLVGGASLDPMRFRAIISSFAVP